MAPSTQMPSATQVKRKKSEEAEAGREEEDQRRGYDETEEADEVSTNLKFESVSWRNIA